jgi:hypothetical protein
VAAWDGVRVGVGVVTVVPDFVFEEKRFLQTLSGEAACCRFTFEAEVSDELFMFSFLFIDDDLGLSDDLGGVLKERAKIALSALLEGGGV